MFSLDLTPGDDIAVIIPSPQEISSLLSMDVEDSTPSHGGVAVAADSSPLSATAECPEPTLSFDFGGSDTVVQVQEEVKPEIISLLSLDVGDVVVDNIAAATLVGTEDEVLAVTIESEHHVFEKDVAVKVIIEEFREIEPEEMVSVEEIESVSVLDIPVVLPSDTPLQITEVDQSVVFSSRPEEEVQVVSPDAAVFEVDDDDWDAFEAAPAVVEPQAAVDAIIEPIPETKAFEVSPQLPASEDAGFGDGDDEEWDAFEGPPEVIAAPAPVIAAAAFEVEDFGAEFTTANASGPSGINESDLASLQQLLGNEVSTWTISYCIIHYANLLFSATGGFRVS
jgi:hypothetical protein